MIEEKIEKFLKLFWTLTSIAPSFVEGAKTWQDPISKKSAAYKLYASFYRPMLIFFTALMIFVYVWDLLFLSLTQFTFSLTIVLLFGAIFVILNNVFVSPLMEHDNLTRKAMLLDKNLSSK